MQTEGSTYTGPVDAAVGIYEKNGVKDGLYAGVSAGMSDVAGSCLAMSGFAAWRSSHPNFTL